MKKLKKFVNIDIPVDNKEKTIHIFPSYAHIVGKPVYNSKISFNILVYTHFLPFFLCINPMWILYILWHLLLLFYKSPQTSASFTRYRVYKTCPIFFVPKMRFFIFFVDNT